MLLVALAGFAWIAITGLMARSELTKAQNELPRLRTALLNGQSAQAQRLSADIEHRAAHADGLVSGPAWWVGAHIPYFGTPLSMSRSLASAVGEAGHGVLPALVQLSGVIGNPQLRQGSTINLKLLAGMLPVTDRAVHAVEVAQTAVAATPTHTWLSSVDAARDSLNDQLVKIQGYLDGAQRGLRTALPLLGSRSPQRIFITFENEAEARGLGGLPAAFAIAVADHGHVRFAHFGNDSELARAKAKVDFGPGYDASYGQAQPTTTFRNSDISPNFPYAAQIWAKMWQDRSGQNVTAAIAIDPTALSYLLKATGPAVAADGTRVSATNVVALTESEQYSRFSDRAARQRWVLSIARAVSQRLVSGSAVRYVAKAVAHAAAERRFMVWSADPAVEQQLTDAGYAGTLGTPGAPLSSFAVTNASGSKLNYYLDRTMTYRRAGCGAGSTATASLIITNDAPRSGLPAYVTHRADHPPADAVPGDDHVIIGYYYTGGAKVESVEVNGRPYRSLFSSDDGAGLLQLDLELKIGVRTTVTVKTAEPPATAPVDIVSQPLARPLHVVSTGTACGSS